jgi:Fe-S-cluster containining protein
MAPKRWYQDGLRFRCTACGNCCSGDPGFVWVNQEEMQTLADALTGGDVDLLQEKHVRKVGRRYSLIERENGDCALLDPKSRQCTVYDARPIQCRTWPFWDSTVRTPATWQETCETCPGAGEGDLYDIMHIDRQRAKIRI